MGLKGYLVPGLEGNAFIQVFQVIPGCGWWLSRAVLTLFSKSMGFEVEIDYNHVSKHLDSLIIRGYRDGKMVFNVSFTESRRQIRKRIETLRSLFYALISTV